MPAPSPVEPPGDATPVAPPVVAGPAVDTAGVRLHVVTGKGGTGKTTVAAALALALARGGGRVLLVEVEGRQGLAQLFDTPPLPYDERRIALATDGGEVLALAIDPEAALLDYLEMFYKIKSTGIAARTLRRIGAIEFATTIAPGLRDVLLTGKVKEAVTRRSADGPAYDAVVLDAPPTGRITRFLGVTGEVGTLAKVGPIKSQSDSVMAVMKSPQTQVHLVTLLEEMPVQETVDGVAELTAEGLPVGMLVVNQVRSPRLPAADLEAAAAGRLDPAALVAGAASVGVALEPADVTALLAEAADHARRVALEATERAELAEQGRPTLELPQLTDSVDLSGLYHLADLLTAAGVRR